MRILIKSASLFSGGAGKMPCIAEFADSTLVSSPQPQSPALELANAFADDLHEAKDKTSFETILGRAIAAGGSLFGSGKHFDDFRSALPAWAGA
jgi:hypothetical protein